MIQSIAGHRWPLLSPIFRVAYESRVEKTGHLLRLDTNRLLFLWGYVDRCPSLLYDVYDLFISTTTYR